MDKYVIKYTVMTPCPTCEHIREEERTQRIKPEHGAQLLAANHKIKALFPLWERGRDLIEILAIAVLMICCLAIGLLSNNMSDSWTRFVTFMLVGVTIGYLIASIKIRLVKWHKMPIMRACKDIDDLLLTEYGIVDAKKAELFYRKKDDLK